MKVPNSLDSVLLEVAEERVNQDKKFGPQNHSLLLWSVILGEEVGEVNRAIYELTMNPPSHSLSIHARNYREELIQVAAVAVAMVESFDRNERETYENLS